MAQPIRKNIKKSTCNGKKQVKTLDSRKSNKKPLQRKVRKHPEYGTSKLEDKFAKDFLDKLGVKYTRQFKAESIGRYYDFYLPEDNLLIEIDGDYYHSYGKLYEDMSPMQKHNKRVDKQKDHWALINCIPLLRIWEHDINKHPSKVFDILRERIHISREEKNKKERMSKRH